MFGCRGLTVFLVAGYLLLGFEGYSAEGENDDSNKKTGYRKTYVSEIEKDYEKLVDSGSSGSSSSSGPIITIISRAKPPANSTFSDFLNGIEKNFHIIFPGTLWCGPGNISKNGNLGPFNKTDACCRAHDKCPSDIAAGQTKGGLINNGAYTRSACSCDHQFYHCLKNAGTLVANAIGGTYFDILGPQCFEYNYPTISCIKRAKQTILKKPCEKYKYDTSKNKTLIWVDNPVY